ncbi:hypothetical protein [Telluribacter sp.]|jgi:hypothetical protein|uniref:hypothetical protein n=1 Tax=Telluribacter sp. TaxID=1978767 RepID=UPI002E161222|nr:hypothetical protein [Telluribacter sp.]
MKKLLLIMGLALGITGAASAQQTFILSTIKHKGFISMTAGYSLPTVSPFGKINEKMMGHGQSGQASVGYLLGRRLGAVATFSHVTNTIRKEVLIESASGQGLGQDSWEASASNCSLQALMVGPMVTITRGRFLLDAQLTGGYALATSPHTELRSEFSRQPLSMITPSQKTKALAVGAGLTARFKLNRWLAAHASAQYITADIKYDNMTQEIQIGQQITSQPLPVSQPVVGLLNLGGGLSLLF